MTSATTYTLVGVVNKFLTILLNVFLWDKHASWFGLLCVSVCLLAGVFYQQAPKRGSSSLPYVAVSTKSDDDSSSSSSSNSGSMQLQLQKRANQSSPPSGSSSPLDGQQQQQQQQGGLTSPTEWQRDREQPVTANNNMNGLGNLKI